MNVLLICSSATLAWTLPALLQRSGFTIDVVARDLIFKKISAIHKLAIVPLNQTLTDFSLNLIQQNGQDYYDWILITDEDVLQEVLESTIADEDKLLLLPVMHKEQLITINSKIGLAQALQKTPLLSPAFRIVHHLEEALHAALVINYPLFVKVDYSSGGLGTYKCQSRQDLLKLEFLFNGQSLLLQQKIIGKELDLSSLYLKGQLIHANYASVKKTTLPFGPSVLRNYHPLNAMGPAILDELRVLGHALGADGFVNISCIETADQQRYYFEADLRPNVWVDYAKYVFNDPAPCIKAWFDQGLTYPHASKLKERPLSKPRSIPYFLRLSLFELLINRHQVWRYLPYQQKRLTLNLLSRKLLAWLATWPIRKWIPQKIRRVLVNYLYGY